jgi:sec-independent protein translocase protein TatC
MATELGDPDLLDRTRASVQERAELPGMSLMEHLQELRKRLIHTILYLLGGCAIAGCFI